MRRILQLLLLSNLLLFAAIPKITAQLDCPDHSLYGLPPLDYSVVGYSNINHWVVGAEYAVDHPIAGIVLFGGQQTYSLTPCASDTLKLEMVFYEDENGLPGDIVKSFNLGLVGEETGQFFFNDPENPILRFEIELPELVELQEGFVSFTSNDDECALQMPIEKSGNGFGKTVGYRMLDGYWDNYPIPGRVSFCILAEDVEPLTPWYAENFSVAADENGELKATIQWDNPQYFEDGAALTDLDAVHVIVNGEEVHTIDNPQIGGNETLDFTASQAGLHTVEVYGTNDAGKGLSVVSTRYIGLDVPEAPPNFSLANDADNGYLSWDPPAKGLHNAYFDGVVTEYEIVRYPDNEVFTLPGTATDFLDTSIPGPGFYNYRITPKNSAGVGGTSEVEGTHLGGGISRNIVIVEKNTGTWCTFCPGAALGFEDLLDNGWNVGLIAYHGDDQYEVPEGPERMEYYGMSGFPTTVIGGTLDVNGGDATNTIYHQYFPLVGQRVNAPTAIDITIEDEAIIGNTFTANITLDAVANVIHENTVLQVVITESHIQEYWLGIDEINHAVRDMFNGSAGTPVNLIDESTITIPVTFELGENWVVPNLEVIAFIQDNTSQEILNGAKMDLSTIISSTEEFASTQMKVYPTPTTGLLYMESEMLIEKIEVYDFAGRLIKSENIQATRSRIDLSDVSSGIYFLKAHSEEGMSMKKIIVE